jgi:hypothetical protein
MVRNWNVSSRDLAFFLKLGRYPCDDWIHYFMEGEQMEGLLQRCSYWVGYLFRNLCSLLFYFYSGIGRLGKEKGLRGRRENVSMTG